MSVVNMPPLEGEEPMLELERKRLEEAEETLLSSPSLSSESSSDVRYERTTVPSGVECVVNIWAPLDDEPPRGIVVVFHGLAGHGQFPSVRLLAELLVRECNFVVYSMDLPGHGQSGGLRGFLKNPDVVLKDSMHVVEYAREQQGMLPLFLAGASMGGAVALLLSLRTKIDGMILLAPMVSLRVPPVLQWLLRKIAFVTPKLGLGKNDVANALNYQIRDDDVKDEILNDPFLYQGSLRAASANTCVELSRMVHKELSNIDMPLLCLLARQDYVIDNQGIRDLMADSCSDDKTLKEYNALHGLMCEEEPLKSQIENDIVDWLLPRISNDGL